MSLLEDVFLQDEAGEAQELERVIEGDEFEERIRSDSDENSERENEAEEDKRRVDPTSTKTRRVTKNPRFILNPARLTGPRGIQVIPDHFKDFKFKGKGHEKEDLDLVLKKLEHWAYRLYPKFKFEDCLKKVETLGKKRPVMVHLHKIRTDQYITEETVIQKDSSNEEDEKESEEPEDEFDKLLQQQIDLARSTPAPDSVRKNMDSIRDNRVMTTPIATSSPTMNNEQRERMLKNRKLAEERRLARLKNNQILNTSQEKENDNIRESNIDKDKNSHTTKLNENGNTDDTNIYSTKKVNRSNVIDSSDDEIMTINTSVTVDIHKNNVNKEIEQNNSISNGDNSNNVLQMDTDSDTDIQNDNSISNNDVEVNDEKKSQKLLHANSNENDTIITQINDTEIVVLDGFKNNKVNDNDINKDVPTVNDNTQLLKESINGTEETRNIEDSSKEDEKCKTTEKEEGITNDISIDKENLNEELMDVDFDDEF